MGDSWSDGIDPATMRGLEIGALDKPHYRKADGEIFYVDHAPTEELRQKYADDAGMADRLDHIVDVDFLWSGTAPLAAVVGDHAPFDFVYASHVVEHVPNLIGWLEQIGSVLRDGGRLSLAVPDKRLCFDVNRRVTDIADVVDAYLQGIERPSYRQIYDFHSRIVAVDAGALWAGTASYEEVWREDLDPDFWPYELCLKAQSGEYVDGHCQVFTPASFLELYAKLVKLDLIPFAIAAFETSQPNTIEFKVVFEKLPDGLDADERRRRQLASIPSPEVVAVPVLDDPRSPTAPVARDEPDPAGHAPMDLSRKEQQLILRKRRVLGAARSLVTTTRRRLADRRSTPAA